MVTTFFHSATSGLENNYDNEACIVPVLQLNQITVGTSEQETLSVVLFPASVGSRLQAGADSTLVYAYLFFFQERGKHPFVPETPFLFAVAQKWVP